MSFKIKLKDKELEFDKKVSLLSLANDTNEEFVVAKVNNRIRDLNYEVYYDATVEFLTVKDQAAIRTYERSLRYLFAMAAEKLYPELEFRFSYNVSRSIFVQILSDNVRVDSTMVKKIGEEMRKIIDADLPFERIIVSNEEAIKIYKERGFEDKIASLKYRPEKTVHFYKCDNYMGYSPKSSRIYPKTIIPPFQRSVK